MVKQFFCSIIGEEKVQTLERLHRPNPMLCKPDLTSKANSAQQGRSCPLSPEFPSSRAFSSQIWPCPPSHLLLRSQQERETGTEIRNGYQALLFLRTEDSFRLFSLLSNSCQCWPNPCQTAEITV